MIKLSEVCDIIGDGLHGTPIFSDDGDYYFVNGNNLFNGKIQVSKDTKKCDESQYLLYKKPLNERTILLSINGTIGNLAYYNGENVILGKSACYLNIKENYDKKYMYYVFLNNDFQKYIKQYATGTTIKNTGLQTIRDYTLSIPDIEEQQAIADVLSSFDDKIELNNKIIKNLEEQAQSLYKHWFVDFEFPDKDGKPFKSNGGKFKDSELGLIPEDWEIYKIKDLTTCLLGGTPSRNREDYWNGDIPWINSGKVNDFRITKPSEYITEAGLKNSATKYMSKNTIVLAITGATLGQISILGINTCANQSVVGISETQQLPHEYLYCCLTNRINEILSHQTGGAQQHINKENIEEFKLIYNENIVREFKNFIESTFEKQLGLAIENQKLIETRDYLLPKLMNGEIKVER